MLNTAAGIFIGITLGISSNASTVRALMIALFFHQGNEGLALGVLFVKAGYSSVKYMLLAAAFIVVTPVGVAIGIGVSSNIAMERAREHLAQKVSSMQYQQAF